MRVIEGLVIVLLESPAGIAGAVEALPPEVAAYIRDCELCDHFRGEPEEGDLPEQVERRRFIRESLEIHCPGTDRRLAALKGRYRDNDEVRRVLDRFEPCIEESACAR